MAYSLANISTANYWNRTTIVKIIVGGWVVSFLRHSVSLVRTVERGCHPVLKLRMSFFTHACMSTELDL